jgi:phosphate transport system substrate-binding protein
MEITVKTKFLACTAVAALSAVAFASGASARDRVQIAGSSTVLPYANIVAEAFGKANPTFKTPVVESGGSSAGLKQFCQGLGANTIDIANSSRPIRPAEREECAKNGVKDIVEVKFGYDGIVFATDVKGPNWALEAKDVYLALAAQIPGADGKMVPNNRKTWKEVNDKLPAWPIVAYIPGEKHGTREVFEERVMHAGCKAAGGEKALMEAAQGDERAKKAAADKACVQVRKDGGTVDIDGDYTETLARLRANAQSVGVFGLSFYENNTDKLKVATMGGITPSVETISTGKYPVSRPLFFYVKKAHVGTIPGLKEYVEFFSSDRMVGSSGPLAEYGLVPAPEAERKGLQAHVKDLKTM